jgi:WD40 repeat protein
MISSIAFCPDRSGLWAAGSFGRSIGLYDERRKGALYLLGTGEVASDRIRRIEVPDRTMAKDRKVMGGVTQVQFSPDGMHLFSASRRDNLVLCWDIRNSDEVLYAMDRGPSDTNQRMSFDIDGAGKWLVAGDTEGWVSVFSLGSEEAEATQTQKAWKLHSGEFSTDIRIFHSQVTDN